MSRSHAAGATRWGLYFCPWCYGCFQFHSVREVLAGESERRWRASPGPVSAHGEAGTVRPSAPTGGAPPDPARPGGPRSLQAAEPSAAPDAVQAGRTAAPPEPPARGPARHSDGPSTPPGPAEGARPQCAAAEGGPGPDPLALRSRRGGLAAAVD